MKEQTRILISLLVLGGVAWAAPADNAPAKTKAGKGRALTAPIPASTPVPMPTPGPGHSVVNLSPEQVGRLVLSQSYRAKEVNANADLQRLTYAQALGVYDFSVSVNAGVQKTKFESETASKSADLMDSYITTANLTKPFVTGTDVTLEVSRDSSRYDLLATAPITADERATTEWAGLTLKQHLWKNSFGVANRAAVRAADKGFQASQVGRIDDLEKLVLEALQKYWDTYVAQESFQESLNSRDRYQKLVEAVRKKSNYGYANPGELSQVQAEYEVRVQNVKTNSVSYLSALDSLATLLNLPPGTEIRFQPIQDVAAPPTATKSVDVENLRSLRAARLKKEAAEDAYAQANWTNKADLSLVGKVYTSGQDLEAKEADSEFLAGSRPKYYVGVSYEYKFGSGQQDEEILNRRVNRDLTSTQYDRLRREIDDNMLSAERKVQSTYNVAVSAKNQRMLRERAVNELNRTYTQGRTDIQNLIEALNKYFDSEVQLIRSIGDYQVALNEWAALRDELIPENSILNPQVQSPNGGASDAKGTNP